MWKTGMAGANPRECAPAGESSCWQNLCEAINPVRPPPININRLSYKYIFKDKRAEPSDLTLAPHKPLLHVLSGGKSDIIPIWLMRQAGRYLPEYRALRAAKGGFLELVNDHEAAAEVTLQPIARFGFDGAILFSDILIVPYALGQDLRFEAGEGPRLSPPLTDAVLSGLTAVPARLEPVYRTVEKVKAALPAETTFLGFAGSPWTVSTYMVAGRGSKEQAEARRLAYRDPAAFEALIAAVGAITQRSNWAGERLPAQLSNS